MTVEDKEPITENKPGEVASGRIHKVKAESCWLTAGPTVAVWKHGNINEPGKENEIKSWGWMFIHKILRNPVVSLKPSLTHAKFFFLIEKIKTGSIWRAKLEKI